MKPPRLFTIVTLFFFVFLVLLPIAFTLLYPFLAGESGHSNDYASLFDRRHLSLTLNSIGIGLGTTFLCVMLGVPLAFIIQRAALWGRSLFKVIYIIPLLIPPYMHAIVWTKLDLILSGFFSFDIHGLWGVVLVLGLANFPFVTLLTISGLKSLDRNLEEASLLCHGKWRTLWRITIPLLVPHILSGAIFVFIFSIADFGVADILRVKVYPVEIFIQYSAFYNDTAAILLSLPLIGVAVSLVFFQKWHMKNRAYIQIGGGYAGAVNRYSSIWSNIMAFGFCLVVIGFSVVLPVMVLLKTAGSLSTYMRVLNTSIDQIGYSLLIAFEAAILTLLLSFSISYLFERSSIRAKNFLEYAAFVPLAVPAMTLGMGLIAFWNRPWIDLVYGSTWIIVFGCIARFIPFSLITMTSGFKQISPRIDEAAHLQTSKWARVMWEIIIPLLKPSFIAGFFIVFILSMGELGMILLVIPPGRETIPIKIYNLMHYGADQQVAALCISLVGIMLAFSGFFLICHKKLSRRVMA